MPCRKDEYRDLERYKETVHKQKERYYAKTAIYPRRAWSTEELEALSDMNISDTELSKKIQRSVGAIQTMRSQLRNKSKGEIPNKALAKKAV